MGKDNYKELKREVVGMRIAIIMLGFICVFLVINMFYDTKWQKDTDRNIKGIVENQKAISEVLKYNRELREDIIEILKEIRIDLKYTELKGDLHLRYNNLTNKSFSMTKEEFIGFLKDLDKLREQEKFAFQQNGEKENGN